MSDSEIIVSQPGTLHPDNLLKLLPSKQKLIVKGELNDADMSVLKEWIQTDAVRDSLRCVDLSGVSGIREIPAQMFFCCRKLHKAILPTTAISLGSQAFAYTPELSQISVEQVSAIETFDCFSCCESLSGMNFAQAKKVGAYSFRKSVFQDSVVFSKLTNLSHYVFKESIIKGDLILPEVTACEEDAFFGVTVFGTINLPNCIEMKYGVFNEVQAVQTLRLTTKASIRLNARSFSEHSCMEKTVLYLHPNKKKSVRGQSWGGVLWKEIRFDDGSR